MSEDKQTGRSSRHLLRRATLGQLPGNGVLDNRRDELYGSPVAARNRG